MKLSIILFGLLLLLIVSPVCAYTATITVPKDVHGVTLDQDTTNEFSIGDVYISTDAPSDYIMTLSVSANSCSMRSNKVAFASTALISSDPVTICSSWHTVCDGQNILYTCNATNTPVKIPLRFRQSLGSNERMGSYTIDLTYILTVSPPSP